MMIRTAYSRRAPAILLVLLIGCGATAAAELVFDGDGDGVSDEIDRCLYSPPGVRVDALGCSTAGDEDEDGVRDEYDDCPLSPVGARVDARGCALDEDLDGIADGVDRCAGTRLGAVADDIGCAAGQTARGLIPRRPQVRSPAAEATPPVAAPQPRPIPAPDPVRSPPPAPPPAPIPLPPEPRVPASGSVPAGVPALPAAPASPPPRLPPARTAEPVEEISLVPEPAEAVEPEAEPVPGVRATEQAVAEPAVAEPAVAEPVPVIEPVAKAIDEPVAEPVFEPFVPPRPAADAAAVVATPEPAGSPASAPSDATGEAASAGPAAPPPVATGGAPFIPPPRSAPAPDGQRILTIYFAPGSHQLTDYSSELIARQPAQLLAELGARPQGNLIVVGHADRKSDGDRADLLAARRAEAVRARLLQLGLPAARLTVRARGLSQPRFSGAELGRNRRVELQLYDAAALKPLPPLPPLSANAADFWEGDGSGYQGTATVRFAQYSSQIDRVGLGVLDDFVKAASEPLRVNPVARVLIGGGADPAETAVQSQVLAYGRAVAVRAYLLSRGITGQRIEVLPTAVRQASEAAVRLAPQSP